MLFIQLPGTGGGGGGNSAPATDLVVAVLAGGPRYSTFTTTSDTSSLRALGGTGTLALTWSGGSATLTPGAAASTVSIPSGTLVTIDNANLLTGPCTLIGN